MGSNLQHRGLLANTACPRCAAPETEEHVFLHCEFATQVWFSDIFRNQFVPTLYSSFKEAPSVSKDTVCLPPLEITLELLPWIFWGLWTARNKLIFENRVFTPTEVLNQAIRKARGWSLAQLTVSTPPKTLTAVSQPVEIPSMSISLFANVSWPKKDRKAGCGWVFFLTDRMLLDKGSKPELDVTSPLMAEALAMRLALLHATSLVFEKNLH